MKKNVFIIVACAFVLIFSGSAMAQNNTYLREGSQELGLQGTLDFEGPQGGVDFDINGSYGTFIKDFLEIGAFANIAQVFDGDVFRLGGGAFIEHHIPIDPMMVPYVGTDLGLLYTDIDAPGEDDEFTLIARPRIGIKWYVRDYVAIDTNLFLALATDDIYVNDSDLDKYDIGLNLGLRVYF